MGHVEYRGDSREVQNLLDHVVTELPQRVQRFVREKVCFVAVGAAHGHGQTWHRRYLKPAWGDDLAEWVIVLSEDGVTDHVVAHEIAHAWSNHGHGDSGEEEEAERLTAEWGF